MCFGRSRNHPIFVSDDMTLLTLLKMQTQLNELRKTGSYNRAFEKRFKNKPPNQR